jgi:hypothetical protein
MMEADVYSVSIFRSASDHPPAPGLESGGTLEDFYSALNKRDAEGEETKRSSMMPEI